ncbi:MAG: hypothetical protein PHI34_13325 [Acidobacteriota bacterium]|nr:hypothetical protein [Acidobacteriota bacterium]
MRIQRAIVGVVLLLLAGRMEPALNDPLKAVFTERNSEKAWRLEELGSDLPADWTGYEYLVLEMKASSPQRFSLWIHTAEGKRRLMIHPLGQGVWMRASVPLRFFRGRDRQGMDLASANNRRTDAYWMGVWGPFGDLKNVRALSVAMDYPLNAPSLEIRSLALAKEDAGSEFLEGRPVLDEFSQWAAGDWPRKVRSREQLEREGAAEALALAENKAPKVGRFGGFLGTKVEATGYFRVTRIDRRWWFVDPEGHLFLSTGANGIRGESGPDGQSLLARRMKAWGLNTIGNWSGFRPTSEEYRKAYVTTLGLPRTEPLYLGMPDVYSPDYVRAVEEAAAKQFSPLQDDPWLLGYFLGNEPPWPGREGEVVEMFLQGPETATKTALRAYLAQGDTPERRVRFVHGMFEAYLDLMGRAVRKADPYHLNLGIRFGGIPAEPILKLGRMFDVCSLNVYEYEPTAALKRFYEVTGRPLLIGEFHFGVPADGLGAGLVQTADQTERAKGYRYYMEQAAALPCFVGAHWFQWTDEPVLGRRDGENYNIGFVDVMNRPYPELVQAARKTHDRLAAIHAGRLSPFGQRPLASTHGTPNSPWD